MVQPTQTSPRNHLTTTDRPGTIPRCSYTQPEGRAVVVVVKEVIGEGVVSGVARSAEWLSQAVRVGSFPTSAPRLRFAKDFEQRFVRRRSSWIESQSERPEALRYKGVEGELKRKPEYRQLLRLTRQILNDSRRVVREVEALPARAAARCVGWESSWTR